MLLLVSIEFNFVLEEYLVFIGVGYSTTLCYMGEGSGIELVELTREHFEVPLIDFL